MKMSKNYEILREMLVSGRSMEGIEEDWLCVLSYTELKDLEIEVSEKPLELPIHLSIGSILNPYNRTPYDIVWCQIQVKEELGKEEESV
jgi:hypothetical protein